MLNLILEKSFHLPTLWFSQIKWHEDKALSMPILMQKSWIEAIALLKASIAKKLRVFLMSFLVLMRILMMDGLKSLIAKCFIQNK